MLDATDQALLGLLQDNCRLSYNELGEHVGLSISAVNERLKKLQAQGVIRRFVALVNPAALDLSVCAFVQVALERPKRVAVFVEEMKQRPEVLECHHLAGEFPLLLKVRVRDLPDLETFVNEQIRSVRGVSRSRISLVLSTTKETTFLAPPPEKE